MFYFFKRLGIHFLQIAVSIEKIIEFDSIDLQYLANLTGILFQHISQCLLLCQGIVVAV